MNGMLASDSLTDKARISFALADTAAVGGILGNLQQVNATTYTATFTGAANTHITNALVGVIAGSWQEGNGNAGAGGSTAVFTVDTVTPRAGIHLSLRYMPPLHFDLTSSPGD
jgi:hypothetical protein